MSEDNFWDVNMLRIEWLKARKMEPYLEYSEADAADHLNLSQSHLQRLRRDRKVRCIERGQSKIYLGIMIADYALRGWGNGGSLWPDTPNGNTGPGNGSSGGGVMAGTAAGTTPELDKPSASALASQILAPQRKS